MPLLDDSPAIGSIGLLSKKQIPMRFPWGQRWNQQTGRLDAPDAKDIGFYGPMVGADPSHIVSEYSVDDMVNGKPVQYPTVAPGMTPEQIRRLLNVEHLQSLQPGGASVQMPQDISDLAYESAKSRISQGRSPFYEPGRDPYPKWSPDQFWPAPYGAR